MEFLIPRAWMMPAPCFEVLKDPAAPRRGGLRARQTLAGRRKSELLRRWRPCWRPQRRVLAMDSRAERASFLRIFSRFDMFRELGLQNSAFTSTATIFFAVHSTLTNNPDGGWSLTRPQCRCRFFVQPKVLIPELTKGIVKCESDLGFVIFVVLAP